MIWRQRSEKRIRLQLDLFLKIGAAAEFSPLIKDGRGQYVDLDELKGSVIRAMGIMYSKLNNTVNGGTKDSLQKAIVSLESDILLT
jgi:hypothetical protein